AYPRSTRTVPTSPRCSLNPPARGRCAARSFNNHLGVMSPPSPARRRRETTTPGLCRAGNHLTHQISARSLGLRRITPHNSGRGIMAEHVRTDSTEASFKVSRVPANDLVDAEACQRCVTAGCKDRSVRPMRALSEQCIEQPHGFRPERARPPLVTFAVKACAGGASEIEIADTQVHGLLHTRPRIVEEQDKRPVSRDVASR